MGTEDKVVDLRGATVFKLRGNVELKVYLLSIEDSAIVSEKVKKISKEKDPDKADEKKQVALYVDIIHFIIKNDNDIKKEELPKVLSLPACVQIIQAATGSEFLASVIV